MGSLDDDLTPASRKRAPAQLVSRVLLVIGLLLMLYVIVIVSNALR